MAAKKRRSAAQIAATKKLVAWGKKHRKASPVKKKAKKKKAKKRRVNKKTDKRINTRPSDRLKKRRRKNTKKGYFPNPTRTLYYVVAPSGKGFKYFTGDRFTSHKKDAAHYTSQAAAKRIAQKIANTQEREIGVKKETKK